MAMIDRKNKAYMEIEEFEEYELTSCVRYEIMIRFYMRNYSNIDSIVEAYEDNKEAVEYYFDTSENKEFNDELYEQGSNFWMDLDCTIRGLCFGVQSYYLEFIGGDKQIDTRYTEYNKTFAELLNKMQAFWAKKLVDEKRLSDRITKRGKDSNILSFECRKKGYSIWASCAVDEDALYDEDTNEERDLNGIKNYINTYGTYEEDASLTIEPNFKRPYFDSMKSSVALDLSLPENELIAYINLLKNAYNSDQDFPKAPLHMLDMDYVNDKAIILDTPKNRAIKWADMFFVYDAIESGMPKRKVKECLDYYYDEYPEKVAKKSEWGIDPKTINQYYDDVKAQIFKIGEK